MPRSLSALQGAREIGHAGDGNEFGGARRHFAHDPVHRRGSILGDHHGVGARGIGGAQAGAEVVRVGYPIQDQQQGID